MDFGLGWFRRRQRSLARGVVALFCAAWLQAALAPCAMAHAPAAGSAAAGGHASDGAHAHGAPGDHAGHEVQAQHGSAAPCLYCPPDHHGSGTCDGRDCAYPHDPQVDARVAGALFAALPASFAVPAPATPLLAGRADPDTPAAVPKVRLSVSYCRFIE